MRAVTRAVDRSPERSGDVRDRRDERIGGIGRVRRRDDEAGIRIVGGDAACGEQVGALAPRQQRLAMAVLILDELERAPVGTELPHRPAPPGSTIAS